MSPFTAYLACQSAVYTRDIQQQVNDERDERDDVVVEEHRGFFALSNKIVTLMSDFNLSDITPSPSSGRGSFHSSVASKSLEDIIAKNSLQNICNYVLETAKEKTIPLVKVRNFNGDIFFIYINGDSDLYGRKSPCEVHLREGEEVPSLEQEEYYASTSTDSVGVLYETKKGCCLLIRNGLDKITRSYEGTGLTDNVFYPVINIKSIGNNELINVTVSRVSAYLATRSRLRTYERLEKFRQEMSDTVASFQKLSAQLFNYDKKLLEDHSTLARYQETFRALKVTDELNEENERRMTSGALKMQELIQTHNRNLSYMKSLIDCDSLSGMREMMLDISRKVQ